MKSFKKTSIQIQKCKGFKYFKNSSRIVKNLPNAFKALSKFFCKKRSSLLVNVLRQPHVGNAGRIITEQVDVRIKDGRVDGFAVLSQHFELMKNINNSKDAINTLQSLPFSK